MRDVLLLMITSMYRFIVERATANSMLLGGSTEASAGHWQLQLGLPVPLIAARLQLPPPDHDHLSIPGFIQAKNTRTFAVIPFPVLRGSSTQSFSLPNQALASRHRASRPWNALRLIMKSPSLQLHSLPPRTALETPSHQELKSHNVSAGVAVAQLFTRQLLHSAAGAAAASTRGKKDY